ncbi:MAG: hypothetical protein ACREBC_22525, partial [Pyrinomonadaceae bacterium]
RHTFATRLRANGVHEWDIRDLLGLTSVRMTSVYTHQTPANLCHAVNTLTLMNKAKLCDLDEGEKWSAIPKRRQAAALQKSRHLRAIVALTRHQSKTTNL